MKSRTRSFPRSCLPALAALAIAGCEKPAAPSVTSDNEPAAPPSPAPVSVSTAARPDPTPPPATPTPIAAVPADHQLAPPGVFYLRARLSVTTDDGIVGILPGTRAVKQSDGKYLVNGRLLPIPPNYLTNDLRIVAQAGAQFAAAEQAARARTIQPPVTQPQMQAGPNAAAKSAAARAAEAETAAAVEARNQAQAAAAAERQRAITEHREAIAKLEAKKKTWSKILYPEITHQRFLDDINDEIGRHHKEMGRLGVAGASLERR